MNDQLTVWVQVMVPFEPVQRLMQYYKLHLMVPFHLITWKV